jgi:hypothetical protein
MQGSIFLARLIGPVLITVGIALIFNSDTYRYMAEQFLVSYALIYVAGVIALFSGLAIVNLHNIWQWKWPVIITVLGWLSVVGGAIRILVPQEGQIMGTAIVGLDIWPGIPGLIMLGFGLWLFYEGYLANTLRARRAAAAKHSAPKQSAPKRKR